jgi:hypothetical protein
VGRVGAAECGTHRTRSNGSSESEEAYRMGWSWLIWAVGGVVLLAAGFGSALAPRLRDRRQARRVAWSSARAAISSATISRDAAPVPVPEADRLLTRAELIAADGGGGNAARRATECARQADQLWRDATGGLPGPGGGAPAGDRHANGVQRTNGAQDANTEQQAASRRWAAGDREAGRG